MSKKIIIESVNPKDTAVDIEEHLEKAMSVLQAQRENKQFTDVYLKDRKDSSTDIVKLVFSSMIEEISSVLTGENVSKSLDHTGLVEKDIQVQGKQGAYTSKRWVKSNDEDSSKEGIQEDKGDTLMDKEQSSEQDSLKEELSSLPYDRDSFSKFVRANAKALKEMGIKSMTDVQNLWKDLQYNKPIPKQEMGREDAINTIRDKIPQGTLDGWFRESNSGYKSKIETITLENPEVRAGALSLAFHMYKDYMESTTGELSEISYKEFLNMGIKVYRGKDSEDFVEGDQLLSYSYSPNVAKKFGSNVSVVTIKPKDTLGVFMTNGEYEILIKNKNM